MAGAANPMALLQQMMGRPAPPGASGVDPARIGQQVAQQMSDLKRTDPEQISQQIRQMRQTVASLIPHTAFTIPGVADALALAMKGLAKAEEAAQKASITQATVSPPIGLSAASSPMPAGGMPGPRGPGIPGA